MTATTVINIRGHARTWNWIKHRVLPVLDQVVGVDAHWVWTSPHTDTVSEESLALDFGARSHEIIWADPPADTDSYTGPAHYDRLAWPSVADKNPKWVICTRPDLLLWPIPDQHLAGVARADEPLEPMELRGWMPARQDDRWVISDFYARMGREAAELMHHRIDHVKNTLNFQSGWAQFIHDRGIHGATQGNSPNKGALAGYLTRPDDLESLPPEPTKHCNHNLTWSQLSEDQRRSLCQQYQIDPRDYGHQPPD